MKSWFLGAMAALMAAGCGKETAMHGEHGTVADLPGALRSLSQKRVFLGHQSVGSNILAGVGALLAEHPGAGIRVVETTDPAQFGEPVLAHAPIGGNGSPQGKIDEFRTVVENGIGERADIAMLKLCYADVTAGTDVRGVFAHYRRVMAGLKQRYPGRTFVHVTVPLTAVQVGPRAWVKRLLGRPLRGLQDNARRAEYNELVRREYAGREPVFDLAAVEATHPERGAWSVVVDGKVTPALVPEFTDDGGHLNDRGRRHVARELLLSLGQLR